MNNLTVLNIVNSGRRMAFTFFTSLLLVGFGVVVML